jgi:hypothetical protein
MCSKLLFPRIRVRASHDRLSLLIKYIPTYIKCVTLAAAQHSKDNAGLTSGVRFSNICTYHVMVSRAQTCKAGMEC